MLRQAAFQQGLCHRSVEIVCRWLSARGADLGGGSKYSNDKSEGQNGEGFHVNSSRAWVSFLYETAKDVKLIS